MKPSKDISRLIEIMAALRTPVTGCPWDLEQDFASIAPYTIEEAYEVADAIERKDWEALCDELGDLLLQPIYHARMAEEQGLFDFSDVIEAITKKMIRRHPHVFGNARQRKDGMSKGAWEKIKSQEKAPRDDQQSGYLDDIPANLPALQTAVKLQKMAARVGFDWSEIKPVLAKIHEELAEVEQAIAQQSKKQIEDEIGDLFFAITNLARHLDIEPDNAMRSSNLKFRRRFTHIEKSLAANGTTLNDATLKEMENYWAEAKDHEHN